MIRLGRWSPGLHGAATAVGLPAGFLPILSIEYAAPDGETQAHRSSLWETIVDPPPDPTDSFMVPVVHDPTLFAGGVVLVIALAALGAAGVLAATARRRPELASRSRTASSVAAASTASVAVLLCAQVHARTLPADYGELIFPSSALGPAFTLLCATALLAVAAAVPNRGTPAPDSDTDTPPMGLPRPD